MFFGIIITRYMKIHLKQIILVGLVIGFSLPCVTLAFAVNLDLSATSNYNFRVDGSNASDFTSIALTMEDLNNDDYDDLIVATGNSTEGFYLIYSDILNRLVQGGGGIINIGDPQNYSIKFTGVCADSIKILDFDGDGKKDILVSNSTGNELYGGTWIISNNLFASYTGSGNIIDLSDPAHYSFNIKGPGFLSSISGFFDIVDINANNKPDLIIGTPRATTSSRIQNGAVFVLYDSLFNNYPASGNVIDLSVPTNYNLKFFGSGERRDNWLGSGLASGDFNGDGYKDLTLGAFGFSSATKTHCGAVYIIFNEKFSGLLGTGNLIDLLATSTYNVKVEGATTSQYFPGNLLKSRDVDQNGKDEIFAQQYIFSSDFIQNYSTSTGILITLASTTSYSLKLAGVNTSDSIYLEMTDFNNDGQNDLVANIGDTNNNSRNNSGSVYIIFNPLFINYVSTTTGNILSLNESSNYSVRYDGAAADDKLGYTGSMFGKLNTGSGAVLSAYNSSNQQRSNSGSFYLILNYPHTISLPSAHTLSASSTAASSTALVVGAVSAPNSVTTIGGVQYSLDSRSLSGTWNSCSPSDGAFDSKTESFICSIPSLVHGDIHDVYVRSYDSNISYTATSSYGRYHFITDVTPPTSFGLLAPRDEYSMYTQNSMPLFSWENSSDDVSGLYKYQLYIDDTLHTDNLSSPWVDVPRLSDGVHTWYVVAMDYNGNTTRSSATHKIYIYNNSSYNTGGSVFIEKHVAIPTTTARVSAASSTPMILVESIKTLQIKLISLLQQLIQLLLQAQR